MGLRNYLFLSFSSVSFVLDNFDCYVFKFTLFFSFYTFQSSIKSIQWNFISDSIFSSLKALFLCHLFLSCNDLNMVRIVVLKYLSLITLSLTFGVSIIWYFPYLYVIFFWLLTYNWFFKILDITNVTIGMYVLLLSLNCVVILVRRLSYLQISWTLFW